MTKLIDPQSAALIERLLAVRGVALRPPPRLTLPEWADQYRMLSAESAAEPGKWRTARVPVARGPMEAVTDTATSTVSVMCCTQLLKTELVLNTVGYYVHQDPAPMIVMQPTVQLAEAFSKDRVAPMARDTPVLVDKISDPKSRDSGNTILHKQFPGGHLTMIGANAPGQLAMRPVRIVLCDEVDKYPQSAGVEGDPIKLLSERAATFWNHKMIFVCSPTVEPNEHGGSRIAREYESSDRRIFEVDCPHCEHRHEMQWRNVIWPEGHPEQALYHCPECKKAWSEAARRRAIKAASERPLKSPAAVGAYYEGYGWRGTKPFEGHAGFRASKLVSPWESMAKLAKKFVAACGVRELLKTFINTQLAETWKELGDAPEWKRLYERREQYTFNSLPLVPVHLMAGADVQKDRIEVEIAAFGDRRESWSIDYRVFPGDTSNIEAPDSPWRSLEALLAECWQYANGVPVSVRMLAVDAGYNTNVVLSWVRKWPASRVIAVKGQENLTVPIGHPKAVDVTVSGKRKARGAKQWPVGTDLLKTELYGWLRQDRPTEESGLPYPHGYCHFPQYAEEFFRQLTAEEQVPTLVRGYRRYVWQKTRDRNEALDCRVYARAAAILCGIDRITPEQWTQNAFELGLLRLGLDQPAEAEQRKKETVNGVTIERRPSTYWNRR